MECSCCGEDQPRVAGLQRHAEIKVCAHCIGWLKGQLGLMDVTPILPMLDTAASAAFYEAAGFDVHVYEGDEGEGGYAFVHYEGESVFDLGREAAAVGAGAFIVVPNADDWHARLTGLGYAVSPIGDEPWGMREFALTDPSGNRLRFGHGIG